RHDEGLEDRSEAIRLNPNLPEAWFARGSAYFLLKNYRRAIEDLARAVDLRQDYAEARDVLAQAIAAKDADGPAEKTASAPPPLQMPPPVVSVLAPRPAEVKPPEVHPVEAKPVETLAPPPPTTPSEPPARAIPASAPKVVAVSSAKLNQ